MLRRSALLFAVGGNGRELNDWSDFQDKMKPKTVGKCFDKTVLDDSIIKTMHLQRALFKLPLPKLENTMKRYVEAVKPVVSDRDFENTKKVVKEFETGVGAKLQKDLEAFDKARPMGSFISEDWFDLYLSDRVPLPLNYNPNLITRNDPDKADGLTRAAFWIASSCRWYKKYRRQTLKPEVFWFGAKNHYCRSSWFQKMVAVCPDAYAAKLMAVGSKFHAFPLDMSQYDNLFNSTRVPQMGKDELKVDNFRPHIIVNYKGNQFAVDVATERGDPLAEEVIYARLKNIVDAGIGAPAVDVGVLTSDNRDAWAASRMELARDPESHRSLELIDSALFVVDLDLETTADFLSSKGSSTFGNDMLAKSSNRWWDKSFSIIVTKDGALSVNFEHSWGDGVAVLRYTVDTFNDSISRSSSTMNKSAPAGEQLRMLKWNTKPIERQAGIAKANLDKQIARCDYYQMVVPEFGKSDKAFKGKVKPDPFMQVAMQLAWWRLNKSTVSTYESASTAAFMRGRTECIRSATSESQHFTLVFDKPGASDEEKLAAMIKAAEKHAAISKNAKMGEGIDRHMFALKKQAARSAAGSRNADAIPEIFTDPSYSTFGSNMISTSSLYSDAMVGGGFGPVSAGYGVGYAAADDSMIFNVTSWKTDGPTHDSETFCAAVHAAIIDMHALLQKTGGK